MAGSVQAVCSARLGAGFDRFAPAGRLARQRRPTRVDVACVDVCVPVSGVRAEVDVVGRDRDGARRRPVQGGVEASLVVALPAGAARVPGSRGPPMTTAMTTRHGDRHRPRTALPLSGAREHGRAEAQGVAPEDARRGRPTQQARDVLTGRLPGPAGRRRSGPRCAPRPGRHHPAARM